MPRPSVLTVTVLVTGILVALGLTVATIWRADGGSMEPQIANGSLVLVDRVGPQITGYRRGDIVILKTPDTIDHVSLPFLIKRVVAVPGERVEIRNGSVYVNGYRLVEPYLPLPARSASTLEGQRVDMIVPRRQVFVLGDHRGASIDSAEFGTIPVDELQGRVWLILGPDGVMPPRPSPAPRPVVGVPLARTDGERPFERPAQNAAPW